MAQVFVRVDTRGMSAHVADLGRASKQATVMAGKAVAKATFDCQAIAKSLAPVDTGFLRASIEASVKGLTGEVVSMAEYGIFVEYGTWKMRAQPYMGPATRKVAPKFAQAMGQIPGKVL